MERRRRRGLGGKKGAKKMERIYNEFLLRWKKKKASASTPREEKKKVFCLRGEFGITLRRTFGEC